jgi:hypothetical protein
MSDTDQMDDRCPELAAEEAWGLGTGLHSCCLPKGHDGEHDWEDGDGGWG